MRAAAVFFVTGSARIAGDSFPSTGEFARWGWMAALCFPSPLSSSTEKEEGLLICACSIIQFHTSTDMEPESHITFSKEGVSR